MITEPGHSGVSRQLPLDVLDASAEQHQLAG